MVGAEARVAPATAGIAAVDHSSLPVAASTATSRRMPSRCNPATATPDSVASIASPPLASLGVITPAVAPAVIDQRSVPSADRPASSPGVATTSMPSLSAAAGSGRRASAAVSGRMVRA